MRMPRWLKTIICFVFGSHKSDMRPASNADSRTMNDGKGFAGSQPSHPSSYHNNGDPGGSFDV